MDTARQLFAWTVRPGVARSSVVAGAAGPESLEERMSLPDVVTRNEWLAAKELLAREKEFTRQRDALNAERRRLPMTVVQKDYRFDGPDGEVSRPACSTARPADHPARHVRSRLGHDLPRLQCLAERAACGPSSPSCAPGTLPTRQVSRAPRSQDRSALKGGQGLARSTGIPPSAVTSTTTSR